MTASWICTQGLGQAAVLDRLGLVETGEIDFNGHADLVCAQLPGGWVVVWAQHDVGFAAPETMRLLSAEGEAVGGHASEITMDSTAFGYSGGALVWSVSHDPEEGLENLTTEGVLPAAFGPIRDEALSQQAQVDDDTVDYVFEAPMALAAAICGFRPDATALPPQTVFKVIEPAKSGKAGELQAARRRLHERLQAGVEGRLYPMAQDLGFEPITGHPSLQKFYPLGASTVFVRLRDGLSETLVFAWTLIDGAPEIAIVFFVRHGDEPRSGSPGRGYKPTPRRTLMERFIGRKQADPEVAIDQAVEDGRLLLAAVDRHLREGAPHPLIRPAVYTDESPAA